ncbi:OmpA family protein [Fulvivirga maritima]|uniref:OmpA family protein n=1 Tax=Fulvivirga maritima TaxID=2904247 RepID=UPI001F412F18|nr:OmpA family protein [Fulvivirga maritima]UII29253.1 OmpA family protein [Fulvivirga maritima]
MIKHFIYLIIICFSFTSPAIAQKTLWASKVIEFSSERKTPIHLAQLAGESYKASQILGEPDIYPGSEGSSRAWTPKKTDQVDYIKVGFSEAIQIQQIAIAESINPTAIWKVYAYDERGNEHFINEFTPRSIPLKGRILNIFTDLTPYKVTAVKVEINGKEVPGYNGIDAIAISDSKTPIRIDMKIAAGIYESVQAEKLSDSINSPYKDLKPLLTPDGKTMFFSRVGDPQNVGGTDDLEDIWFSEKNSDGEWKKAQNIGTSLNNKGPNFICSVTPKGDGYVLLLGNRYLKNKMTEGLSIATQTEDGLSDVEPVIIENEENFSPFANYYLGINQQIIIMSVHRRNGEGGRDLYVSFKQENGRWSTPKNLGSTINTPDEESSPFLAADGKTLYFSSKGHLGFGGSDVYISRRLDDTWTNWSTPENLGPYINSADDEIFFHLAYDSKYAYYTRGDGQDADIYRLELPAYELPDPTVELNVKVINKNTKELIPEAKLVVHNKTMDIAEWHPSTDNTGKFDFIIPKGYVYEISAKADKFLSIDTHQIDLTRVYESETMEYVLHMTPIEVGERIPLDNIYFDFDKATLRDESIPQLNKVVRFMEDNPKVTIQLDGHTCSLGSESYNKRLSEDRARSVMDYLLKEGIKKKRVSSLGFGEAQPIASNETESGRVKNRRVEFVITDK